MTQADRARRFAEFFIEQCREEEQFQVSTLGHEKDLLAQAFHELGFAVKSHPSKPQLMVSYVSHAGPRRGMRRREAGGGDV